MHGHMGFGLDFTMGRFAAHGRILCLELSFDYLRAFGRCLLRCNK
jgi:hypothetical protein